MSLSLKVANLYFEGSSKNFDGSTIFFPIFVFSYGAGCGINPVGNISRQLVSNAGQQSLFRHFTTCKPYLNEKKCKNLNDYILRNYKL